MNPLISCLGDSRWTSRCSSIYNGCVKNISYMYIWSHWLRLFCKRQRMYSHDTLYVFHCKYHLSIYFATFCEEKTILISSEYVFSLRFMHISHKARSQSCNAVCVLSCPQYYVVSVQQNRSFTPR
jgi:hypothetical protein